MACRRHRARGADRRARARRQSGLALRSRGRGVKDRGAFAGPGALRLLVQDDALQLAGYPPEALVVGELRYALDKRGSATCALDGDVGPLGDLKKDRPAGHVERCRWWLYNAPGDDTLLVEQ